MLQRRSDHVLDFVRQISEDSKVADLCREIYFLVHNPFAALAEIQGEGLEHHYNLLKAGFKCNLFRMDGSSKRAVVDINEDYEVRAYKHPNGEVKKKYVIDVRNLKDFQFAYPANEELWSSSVFLLDKGLFDLKKVAPQSCCSLMGSSRWGELSFINL